jgi:DNA-directed RNA polymerase-3 subunit RPC5
MADVQITQPDPDPIKMSYDVFIKPQISGDRQIFVLQFPCRDPKQNYCAENQSQPLSLRIKPNAGMLELDVPVDVFQNYDKEKGLKWGGAMKKSNMTKGGGSHGMPGGFGIGGAQPAGRGRGRELEDYDNHALSDRDYQAAVESGRVLKKQTLGGQSVASGETTPQYMIGVFRKSKCFLFSLEDRSALTIIDQLHLTPANHIVQMRPQFHHIDAQAEQERVARRDPNAAAPRTTDARAIHMTVKTTVDGEEENGDTMAQRISATQAELWRNHRYVDEAADESWAVYETLFVGGGVEDNELTKKVPKLVSGMEDIEYLDFISSPRDAARLSRSKRVRKDEPKKRKGKEKMAEDGESDGSSTLSDMASDSETEGDSS